GTVLLHETEQRVATLLDRGEPTGIALDPRRIIPRRLPQLLHVRERPVEQRLPLGRGRLEPLEARHELRRAGEARGVERLLELADEPPQLVGVRQSLRFDLERLGLPALRRGPRDLVYDVPQVVGLATDLLLPGSELGL